MSEFKSAQYLVLTNFTWRNKPVYTGDPLHVGLLEDHEDIQAKPEIFEKLLQFVAVHTTDTSTEEKVQEELKEEVKEEITEPAAEVVEQVIEENQEVTSKKKKN